ncbi:MAG: HEAT repeat domain-containing protein [Isosphaeraceae bacterium]|nr:HEAT repeat domain-containing protein [Isosphaeraceae bacterium]
MDRRVWIPVAIGVIGVGAVVGVMVSGRGGSNAGGSAPRANTAAPSTAQSAAKASLTELARMLEQNDATALAAIADRSQTAQDAARVALTDAEGAEWVEVAKALRTSYSRLSSADGRATAAAISTRILEKFAVDPAPASWIAAFPPVRDILLSAVIDQEPNVRAFALGEVAKLWSWAPARTPLPVEEQQLAEWKDSMAAPVVRRLGDAEAKVRVAAVACLGLNPIHSVAERALPHVEDRNGDVRHQVLASFGARPNLLGDEAVLQRLHDSEPGIPQLAEIVLKARGLNRDQIFLGRMITSPQPEQRASVIPMLRGRADLDPVVWLVRLSSDADESVRVKAVAALGEQDTPESRRRLREVATTDKSASVREAAEKLVAAMTTASLPPLPGSPRLNPRAN